MINNEEREIIELIWKYYSKSSRMMKLEQDIVGRTGYPYPFVFAIFVIWWAVSIAHFLSMQNVVRSSWDIIMIGQGVICFFASIYFLVFDLGIYRDTDWFYLGAITSSIKTKQTLRRMLKDPYSSELILGTIEALEAELVKKQSSAIKVIADFEERLRRQRGQLEGVKAKISERIADSSADESKQLTDLLRLKEADEALHKTAAELVAIEAQRQKVAASVEPASNLIAYLRTLYADAQEVEVIARAKAVVSSNQRELVGETVRQLQGAALRAYTNLEIIANLAQAKLDAEREVEQVAGILPSEEKLQA